MIADQYWRALPPSDDAHRNQQDGRPRRAALAVAAVAQCPVAGARPGVPLVGFTWYSLTDQIDWSIALMAEAIGLVYPVGLFDLNRESRSSALPTSTSSISTGTSPIIASARRSRTSCNDERLPRCARLRSGAEPAAAAFGRNLGSDRDRARDRRPVAFGSLATEAEILGMTPLATLALAGR